MASISDVTIAVPTVEFNKLRDDVSELSNAIERLQVEQNVLLRLLPNLVDMAASLKVLKGRFKDINVRVSSLELFQNELRELQRRVDAMGLIVYAPRPVQPPSPAPGIYS